MRKKTLFFVVVLSVVNHFSLFAQGPGGPCLGADADNPCPLDSWVVVLACALVVFVFFRLSAKKNVSL